LNVVYDTDATLQQNAELLPREHNKTNGNVY